MAPRDSKDIKLDVGLLKNDVANIKLIFGKLDLAIDKLQELSSTLTKMISLHEQKLEYQERADEDLNRLIETRRTESQMDIRELHSRITTINRELTDKIEESENKIMHEIRSLKDCVDKPKNSSIMDRLDKIESWKIKVTVAILFVVWLLSNFDFLKVLQILKIIT